MREVKGTLKRKELNQLKKERTTFKYTTDSGKTSYFVKGSRLKLSELKLGQAKSFGVSVKKYRRARKIRITLIEKYNIQRLKKRQKEKEEIIVERKKHKYIEYRFVSGFDYQTTKKGFKVKPNKKLSLNVEISLIRKIDFDNVSAGRNIDIFIQEFLANNGFPVRNVGYDGGILREFSDKEFIKESTLIQVDFRRENKTIKWSNILETELDNFCRGL